MKLLKAIPLVLLMTLIPYANASGPQGGGGDDAKLDPRKALYLPVRSSAGGETGNTSIATAGPSAAGGETGNGGDGTIASQAAGIAERAALEVRSLCQNHPELRGMSPCREEPDFSKFLANTAWVPATSVFLCKENRAVIGGLRETEAALTKYGPCTERDAVNFGKEVNSKGQYVILVSQSRYQPKLAQLESAGTSLVQNILHEVLSLTGADRNDSYAASTRWIQFIGQYSRISRLYSEFSRPDLVTLTLNSDLGAGVEDRVYATLAPKRYAKVTDSEGALYRLNLTREAVSERLPDGSQDQIIQVTLERLSDQGVIQVLVTRDFRFNHYAEKGVPQKTLAELFAWLASSTVPVGML